jgi:hypothetical protein
MQRTREAEVRGGPRAGAWRGMPLARALGRFPFDGLVFR